MGKKGKNKNVAAESTAPKAEVKPEKKEEIKVEPPKVQEIKVEPPKVDTTKVEQSKIETKVEPPKIEAVVLKEEAKPLKEESPDNNDAENESGTLKSKKKRNRKKKNTLTTSDETPKQEVIAENIPAETPKSEPTPVENESQNSSDTLKKKRKRNRKKNNSTVGATTEEKDEEKSDETPEKLDNPDSNEQSATSTLKKRKRNRNKNKNATNDAVNEALAAAQKIEPPVETTPAPETQSRKGKKQKRFDLSSKKTILDEIQEKQEREQKEARENIQKEIAKREKLLETIDMVLDCHKTEAELAKNQQESLKDLSKLAQAPKQKSKPSNKSPPKSPNEEQLVNKIEQVLGVTKLEIKNVQNQQAYVDRLETELAKVKQNKDRLLRGENLEASTSSVIPPQIQQMTSQICDLTKETPKTKEELIKEIQNRDKLMSEINRVLDTTKNEIEKVQKQQKIISNLEVELNKIKEQEIAEKLMALEEEAMEDEPPKEEKLSTASASLLDALMANVGKLKEAQALKEKQKQENESKKKAPSPPKNAEQIVKKVEEPKPQEAVKKPIEEKVNVEIKKQEEKPKVDNKKPSSPKDNKKGNKAEKKSKGDEAKKVEEKSEIVEQKTVIEKEEVKPVTPPVIEKECPKEEPKVEVQKVEPVAVPVIEQPVSKVETKPIEVKPITSNEPKQESPKPSAKNDNKKNNKKDSPKGNAKNKNQSKKDSPPVVEPVIESAWQKPSMAEMLKNAPDPPPEEVNKKEEKKSEENVVEEKVDHAPLARPESAIIEVPIIPAPQAEKIDIVEKAPEQPIEVIAEPKVDDEKKESSPIDENMVIVSQQEVEQMIMELEKNELTGSKNDEAGGFASPVNDQKESVKPPLPTPPTKNEGKSAKPSKAPSKPSVTKPSPKPQNNAAKPKVDTNKPKQPTDAKKQPTTKPAPVKPQKPTESAPKTESLEPSNKTVESTTPKNENVAETTPKSPPVPKSPSKPDPPVSKSSASKPVSSASPQRAQPKAGNVTKTSSTSSPSRPTKSNTPSPSKSPSSVTKPTSTPSNITSASTPKPKPPTPLATSRTAPPKPPSTKPPTQSQTTKSQPAKPNASKPSSTTTASKQQQSTSDSVSRHRQMEPLNNVSNFSQPPAFSLRKPDEKSTPITPQTPNQMKAILTADGSIKIFLPPTSLPSIVCNDRHRSKDVSRSILKDSPLLNSNVNVTSSQKTPKPINLMRNLFDESGDDDDETLSQYKMTPKNIFMATICHVCKVNLSRYFLCKECKMISYCKEEHMKIDYLNHKALCMAIQLISKRRGGHIYNMAKHLSSMEFRNLRIHSILLCEEFLNRSLCAFERELFLFPRLCHEQKCREWRDQLLNDCEKCGQVSYCTLHPLNEQHNLICSSFALLQRIVLHEKSYGRIHVELPQKVLKRVPILTENVFDTLRLLYRSIHAFQDDCVNAALMQIATTPLTAFYGYQKAGMEFNNEQMVIHLVGAEMQFEGDSLEKWESFFLHLAHGVSDLLIVFIGPELNTENLPLEIISRTRMCKSCRLNCCGVRFDFQCKKFYHDYCSSSSFIKPDLICFFNPAFHRPGFRGFDTWPKTIKSAISTLAPTIVTSTTENENFLDLQKIQKVCDSSITVLMPPQKNPYASTRPERNFVSDDDVSIMFKNNFIFVVSDRNLIDL